MAAGGGPGGAGGGQRLRGEQAAGRKHIWILQSHRWPWEAFVAGVASVRCGAAGALPGMAVAGPTVPDRRPIPTFRHFREKLMMASVSWMVCPLPCGLPLPVRRGQQTEGAQGTLAVLLFPWTRVHKCVCDSPSSVLAVTSRFPKKEQEINIQIHLSSK